MNQREKNEKSLQLPGVLILNYWSVHAEKLFSDSFGKQGVMAKWTVAVCVCEREGGVHNDVMDADLAPTRACRNKSVQYLPDENFL